MSWRVSAPLALGLLAAALMLAVVAATANGAVAIPLRELPSLLWGAPTPETALWRNVLIDIRLPRVLFALVAGAGLAVSGAAMQALFRNPLAEPGLIGISAGGALGAVAAIVLTSGGFWITAPAAFAGSLLATLCAYAVGRRVPGVAGLLLAGVAITAMAFSLIGLFTFVATDAQLRDLTFWNMGSLGGANWKVLAFLGPWVLLVSLWLMSQWRVMNALLLGEREAQHLGYTLKRVRARLVLASALIVGPLVAATGTIVFVGLVVPHLVRMTLGANHRWLLPATILAGGLALILADWLARTVVVPAELPIGLVTGLVGGPFFLWLLARGRRIG
ncbi:iron ABC transporter permease [Achromobacter sp. ACM04]|jgi:iron complex transport system permease protein|uniref:Vitamin B12 import system permease protein BtuC n=3 Tax=Achromobacter aegrifaciens TaxID=1287736 RepID=A0AAD2KJ75_ACHAE|nr:iron ABC transporter permease [Achromobacter sp. ACM04]MBD9431021.1 iron ABC transporter permease [Achromobacter sp. ACM03]MBD9472586.1 iron ABC transporter permease [Achromobacter sp. ACM01]CAB3630525.1 Hemin transport system permease protein HmuU [Achromobacter aegrifaciens]CAB3811809.1 Hemin transport system permease protein HmuU [Achromobacter aegrifaciens]